MGSFPFIPTAEVFTGNPATVQDPYVASPGVGNYLMPNGARVYPGSATYQRDATGHVIKLRYVRYNPTAGTSAVAGGPVYWADSNLNTVSPTASEGPMGMNGIAGALLNVAMTTGNWCYIQVAGYNASLLSAASMTGGDIAYGNATAYTVTRVASGAAGAVQKVFYTALGPVVASKNAGIIQVEDIGPA